MAAKGTKIAKNIGEEKRATKDTKGTKVRNKEFIFSCSVVVFFCQNFPQVVKLLLKFVPFVIS